ncbi:MAG: carboxymuconolactone decarboxylase family protein [Betaproteobacteria bacterium]|nr:carboxymuconolactone decarboxylase family protein [Betaproteobacteria bacterium]
MSEPKRHFHDMTQEVTHNLAYMRAELPDVMKGFHDLGRATAHAGALDTKTKELIAVALGVAAHCDPCIGFHVKAFVRHGGTKRELAEALGMAVYMGGGPSLMYAANALAAIDEFLAAAQAKAAAAT